MLVLFLTPCTFVHRAIQFNPTLPTVFTRWLESTHSRANCKPGRPLLFRPDSFPAMVRQSCTFPRLANCHACQLYCTHCTHDQDRTFILQNEPTLFRDFAAQYLVFLFRPELTLLWTITNLRHGRSWDFGPPVPSIARGGRSFKCRENLSWRGLPSRGAILRWCLSGQTDNLMKKESASCRFP